MENRLEKRVIVKAQLGDIISSVYEEVASMPLSDQAKNAMVMLVVGEILNRNGHKITLRKKYDTNCKSVELPRLDVAGMI